MERIIFLCLTLMISITIVNAQIEVDADNNVGVGTTEPESRVAVYNNTENNSLFIRTNTTTSDDLFGINTNIFGNSDEQIAIYNRINGGSSGSPIYKSIGLENYLDGYSSKKLGISNRIIGRDNNESIEGMYNSIEGNYSNKKTGIYNYIKGKTKSEIGLRNSLRAFHNGSGNMSKTGIYNDIEENDTRYSYGLRNIMADGASSNQTYGMHNNFEISNGDGVYAGSYSDIEFLNPITSGDIYGVRANLTGTSSPDRVYGIHSVIDPSVAAGVESWAGYFDGGLYVKGTFVNASDRNLKDDIKAVPSQIEKLKKLKPKSYKHKNRKKDDNSDTYGFIAQEFRTVYPELVKEVAQPGERKKIIISKEEVVIDRDGNKQVIPENYIYEQNMDGEPMLAMDYNSIIALLVSALQEQQGQIETIQKSLDQCGCGAKPGKSNNGLKEDTGLIQSTKPIFLHNKLQVKIYPNPTDTDATLEINSEESGVHQIHVYDEQGRLVHKDEIYVSSGTHQHELDSSDWSGGLYYVNTTYQGISKSVKLIVAGK